MCPRRGVHGHHKWLPNNFGDPFAFYGAPPLDRQHFDV